MLFFVSAPYLGGMKLKDWNVEERPREKLLRLGAQSLSHAELLAILSAPAFPGPTPWTWRSSCSRFPEAGSLNCTGAP